MKIPLLSDILDSIQRTAKWFGQTFKWWYGLVLSFVLTPIEWLLKWLNGLLDTALKYWESLNALIVSTEIFNISSYWAAAGPFLAKANALVPINFIVGIAVVLAILWVICQAIRLIIRLIPTMG